MSVHDEVAYKNYWDIILRAGQIPTREEQLSYVEANTDALEEGALATMHLLVDGALHPEDAFAALDSAKAIATKRLINTTAVDRADPHSEQILARPDPSLVASYLKSKPHSAAIISFHFISRCQLAIFMVANVPTENGTRGFGDVYYEHIWIDGFRDEIIDAVEQYADSANIGKPDHHIAQEFVNFIASSIFLLLFEANPVEVVFIPHKLLHVLPLHAISTVYDNKRVYLHDIVQAIHYASSFAEIAYTSSSPSHAVNMQKQQQRFLSVLDVENNPFAIEQKALEVYRGQLEAKGVIFDTIIDPKLMPNSFHNYIWANITAQDW